MHICMHARMHTHTHTHETGTDFLGLCPTEAKFQNFNDLNGIEM